MAREKKSVLEKEWGKLLREEQRFLRQNLPQKPDGWQEKISKYVPEKLERALEGAFCKAFSLIFEKGSGLIEKTLQKEKREQDYKIREYAAQLRGNSRSLRAFGREAAKCRGINMALAAAEGVGMGIVGLGLPDIPLFCSMLLKSIYEMALNFGFSYDTQEEQLFILKLIETALLHGEELERKNKELDFWIAEQIGGTADLEGQIKRTSDALSRELLYFKFVQGIPVIGVIGGVSDLVYQKKISAYASLKYRRRFLEKKKAERAL